MSIHTHASTVQSAALGLGIGVVIAQERAKARYASCQRAADAMDTFALMKSELIYERSLNDALVKRIALLEREIQILEAQLDEE